MRLTSLTNADPEARAILDLILPTERLSFGRPVQFAPATKNAAIVGAAFDYLLRFEAERRFPAAKSTRWVAEVVATMLAPIAAGDKKHMPMAQVARWTRQLPDVGLTWWAMHVRPLGPSPMRQRQATGI